jgi:hypothetical protein
MLLAASAGCHVHHHHTTPPPTPAPHARAHAPGPPPHAPAHGYRHKHRTHAGTVELVFDTGLDAYIVIGREHHFLRGDRWYRWSDGGWMVSASLDGHWVAIRADRIPRSLARGYAKGPGRGKKKGHWKHPAKHGY